MLMRVRPGASQSPPRPVRARSSVALPAGKKRVPFMAWLLLLLLLRLLLLWLLLLLSLL